MRTNISKNALCGDGQTFGKTDENIEKGLTVEEACDTLVKAMYLKRNWITLGGYYYILAPKIAGLSETITKYASISNFKQQKEALKNSK